MGPRPHPGLLYEQVTHVACLVGWAKDVLKGAERLDACGVDRMADADV